MVANGRGISFTTQYTQHTTGRIKCIPLSDKKTRWEQCLYWNKNREFTKEELAFKDFVVQFYQDTHQKLRLRHFRLQHNFQSRNWAILGFANRVSPFSFFNR